MKFTHYFIDHPRFATVLSIFVTILGLASLNNLPVAQYPEIVDRVDVAGDDSRVVAQGPVGFTAATEAPRLELVMGWPPAQESVAGSLNFVASYGIVTNGSVNPMPCQTNIMAFSVNAGAANSSPNTFADWPVMETGVSPSVSLWSKTMKSAGAVGLMCPS